MFVTPPYNIPLLLNTFYGRHSGSLNEIAIHDDRWRRDSPQPEAVQSGLPLWVLLSRMRMLLLIALVFLMQLYPRLIISMTKLRRVPCLPFIR